MVATILVRRIAMLHLSPPAASFWFANVNNVWGAAAGFARRRALPATYPTVVPLGITFPSA